MYFMAAEQIFQNPLIGQLVHYLFAPIVKRKGASDAKAVRETLRRIRLGESVCVFPEGNTSFDGLSGPITTAIGRLLQAGAGWLPTVLKADILHGRAGGTAYAAEALPAAQCVSYPPNRCATCQ